MSKIEKTSSKVTLDGIAAQMDQMMKIMSVNRQDTERNQRRVTRQLETLSTHQLMSRERQTTYL